MIKSEKEPPPPSFDDVLKRMLSKPPEPHKPKQAKKPAQPKPAK